MKKGRKYVVRREDLWSEMKVLEEEECSYVALEELLVKVEVSCAHYRVENKIARHCTRSPQHIDSDASHRPP
jgi:hypothetical protein